MDLQLRDGTELHIRPIRSDDKELLAAGFALLSEETRQLRFLTAKPRLTKGDLRYLTEIDGRDHVAVVAERQDGELAAVARVVSNGDGTAEVAVVVADDCRGQGFGESVVAAAVDRYAERRAGDDVVAHVQTDNRAAMRLFVERLGGRTVASANGVALVRLPNDA